MWRSRFEISCVCLSPSQRGGAIEIIDIECVLLRSLKKQLYRDLKWKKSFLKKKKCLKTHSSGFFTKINSSEQNICRNRRLKIHFQRRCASQNKTRKIKTNSNSILLRYVLKIFQLFYNINDRSLVIFLNLHNYFFTFFYVA